MKRRILLVDDDVAVLLTLKAVLELNRFTVETATSAAEAIEKLSSGIYHMVITDARMENENAGFEVVRGEASILQSGHRSAHGLPSARRRLEG